MKVLPWTLLGLVACGPETTSFRTTDRSDTSNSAAAAYSVRFEGREVASVTVSSNGGYISSTDESMTHIGFEIRNSSARPLVFDDDALRLIVVGKGGAALPAPKLVVVTPLGPAEVPIAPGATTTLDAYFLLSVRPRTVDSMRVHWSIDLPRARYEQTTSFVRDDDGPVADPPAAPPTSPGA